MLMNIILLGSNNEVLGDSTLLVLFSYVHLSVAFVLLFDPKGMFAICKSE